MKPLLILVACASLAAGQSASADRAKAADYPVSGGAKNAEIGAEFLGHTIPSPRGYYYAKDYVVVDVGVFPKSTFVAVSAGQFTLRVNGNGLALVSQSPGIVAGSLKHPDWTERGGLDARASVGGVAIDSQPRPTSRFPDDQRGYPPPGVADVTNPDLGPDHDLETAALPDAHSDRPVKGCLYFASKIKTKKIKSLELEWNGAGGEHAVLKLR